MIDGPFRGLMAGLLLQQVRDYKFKRPNKNVKGKSRHEQEKEMSLRRETVNLNRNAAHYLFNNGWESEHYVLGFKSICSVLGHDWRKVRKALRTAGASAPASHSRQER